ncbi:MAG TPA: helix-turn-helix transcriptional regulator [Candidatus Dormibacteraeota bacterium]
MIRDGARPWSRWLRRYRDERDLTQEELGAVLGVEGKTVSAWENGQRPGRRHARTICATLRTTRAELGLQEPEEGPVVGRRDFFRLSAGVGSLALFGPWAGVDRVDAPAIEGFEAATGMLERLWMRVGAAAALGPALGHVESITRLLQGALPAGVRPRLCGVLAESSALLAACKSWMGDADGAGHFASIALDAARQADDPDVAVHVLLSVTSADRAVDAATRLRRYVEGDAGARVADAGPATRAWAAALAAEVHAAEGRASACLGALDDAAALVRASAAAGPAGTRYPWPDEAWLAGERGVSLSRLGRAEEARRALALAVARTGEERALDRLRWALAVARTHAADGDRATAARVADGVRREARRLRNGELEAEARTFELEMGSR